jgi:D-amino-acid dehydrogenase
MSSIAVLGAGITGVTTAFQLNALGHEVTVYDRHRYPAMETSFANGGQLSASNAEVWNQWSTVIKGIKWMFDGDAPLLVNPKPALRKIDWMARFLGNIPNYKANTISTAKLAVAARPLLHEMADAAGLDFDYSPAGILHFYETEKDFAHADKVNELLAAGGLHRERLNRDQVFEREPTLRGDILGGYWTETDSTGDIHKYTVGLAKWLEKQGVTFMLGHNVDNVRHTGIGVEILHRGETNQYDAVVVCAGVASRGFAKKLGDNVPIYPVKGYSVTVELDDEASQAGAPTVSLLDDKAKIVTSRLGKDRLRIAGTAEFNGENRDIRADRIAPLTGWCEKHFPEVNTEQVIPWAGLRPMMPSMLPKVGAGRKAGVFYNTGHGHLGWTLSAATAQAIAMQVTNTLGSNQRPISTGKTFKSA